MALSSEPASQDSVSLSKSRHLEKARCPAHPDSYYHSSLSELERLWVDRYDFLLQRGYRLRSRYRPGWVPSWLNGNVPFTACEDYRRVTIPHLLDAENVKDGTTVCIKMLFQRNTKEIQIARYLSQPEISKEKWNHSGFVLDYFTDPEPAGADYMVMPLLRKFDNPEFMYVEEVVDFVTQVLEGLVFLHSHHIAHNDLSGANIMMDARPIIPNGWHPASSNRTPDFSSAVTPLARIDHPVSYYIIDFGVAHRLQPDDSPMVTDFGGRDPDVPELKHSRRYNPFKVDVFTTGNTFYTELLKKYHRLEFLAELIVFAMTEDPQQRPTASMVLERWYKIEKGISHLNRRMRLQKREETFGESLLWDAVAIARQAPSMFMGSRPSSRRRD